MLDITMMAGCVFAGAMIVLLWKRREESWTQHMHEDQNFGHRKI
jgi:hypothetical protein